jgi:16S rRNA (guanine527-N7)-methyltransferase
MSLSEFQRQLDALPMEGVRVQALLRFYEDVLRFNRGRNLVSRSGGAELVQRLILECASAARALPLRAEDRILDLGTGAGFPGIPFTVACPVACKVFLLDRRPVACDFLRRERIDLGLQDVEILEGQSQELLSADPGLAESFPWVLMKAVAPPPAALRLARPFLSPDGAVVLFRRQGEEPDARLSREGWEREACLPLPCGVTGSELPALHLFRRLR